MKKRETFLPFCPPSIGQDEIDEVVDTLKSGWITTGPKTKKFEEQFASYVKSKHALGLSSATAGLQIALAAHDIGKGDVVISTAMTFCSGITAIEDVEATPLLVDVDAGTLNIDPKKIREAIENSKNRKKIKAIIPVHFAGHPCEMDEILKIAKEYNLRVIEDAAHAVAAKYKGKPVGSIGDMTAFSFYVTKNITTAEGGMLTGNNDKAMSRARIMSLHGISHDSWKRYSKEGAWRYEVVERGFKANMTDIQSSLGIHQLKRLSDFQKRRKEIVSQYKEAFSKSNFIEVPACSADVEHAWHLYIIRLNETALTINRNQFIEELKERNIGSSVHFIPIHLHPYFQKRYGYKPEDYPVAYQEYQRMLSLPLYPAMADRDEQDVIAAVEDIVQEFSK